jgi:hypothetical protein
MAIITRGEFDKELIYKTLSKLEIIPSNGVIITKYDGKFLAEKEISKKYESFDFHGYVKKVIDEITSNFDIITPLDGIISNLDRVLYINSLSNSPLVIIAILFIFFTNINNKMINTKKIIYKRTIK